MFKATNYILAVVDWIENTLIPGFFQFYSGLRIHHEICSTLVFQF